MSRFAVERPVYLADWRVVRPRYHTTQEEGLEWIARAHAQAESLTRSGFDTEAFTRRLRQAITRFGCSDGQIAERAHELGDFRHTNWEEMEVFRLIKGAGVANVRQRMQFFAARCDDVLQGLYLALAFGPGLTMAGLVAVREPDASPLR